MDCQSDPRCVLRVVSNGGESANIRDIFTNAGERPQIFPYTNGIGQHYYFVEFQHRKSVERALRLQLGSSEDLRLYPLDGLFLEQFLSCKARGTSHQVSAIRDCHPTWSNPRRDRCDFPVQKQPSCTHPYGLNTPEPLQSDQDDRSHNSSWTPGGNSTSYSAHTSQMYVGAPIGMRKNLFRTPSLPYSLETRLVFEIQGRKQVYDLSQDSGLNPESIIELLRLSKSERGNWMMAGAYFRRRGNPRAALQVIATMVQVMLDHGHNLDNLKAAFPLLAGCELDLARLSRNVCDEKGYNDHLDNAKSWLQMIYGVDSPAVKLAAQNAFSSHTTPQPSETQSSHGKESRLLKRYNPMTKAGRTLSTGGNSRRSHCLIARKSLPEAPFGRISNTGNFD